MTTERPVIEPDWPAPERVRALCTTRSGGVSQAPWDSFNLGGHVGDRAEDVLENRRQLADRAGLPVSAFGWLQQVHGTAVARLPTRGVPVADASVATETGVACTILTADCLPVLFCNRSGSRVAAAHAGWRGLVDGVLEQTLGHFERPEEVMAWLGPAIGPTQFEVGPEVQARFVIAGAEAENCFRPSPERPGHFFVDIYQLARQRLQRCGVEEIHGGSFCTVSDPGRFFSYRRDGETGRMASCIWMT